MLQKAFAKVWILIIVLVVIISGILAWQFWPEPVEQNPPILEESPIADETGNWQTYRNDKYGYEIKYPLQNWQTQGGNDRYEIRNAGAFMDYSETYWRDLRILILENERSAKG